MVGVQHVPALQWGPVGKVCLSQPDDDVNYSPLKEAGLRLNSDQTRFRITVAKGGSVKQRLYG